jgi:hypothetical protein
MRSAYHLNPAVVVFDHAAIVFTLRYCPHFSPEEVESS